MSDKYRGVHAAGGDWGFREFGVVEGSIGSGSSNECNSVVSLAGLDEFQSVDGACYRSCSDWSKTVSIEAETKVRGN